MKYASVCSGVEAASLAWEYLGWEAAWFSEIEPFPCAVLKERFPSVPNLGDMTKIKIETMENGDQKFYGDDGTVAVVPGGVDLLVGGTPCQGFSVAGKQGGLNDDRSVLCLTFVRILKEMRPRWFVWENVPGVFSTNDGEDIKAFLRAIDEVGYCCAWRVLDAQYVRVDGFPRAVPQRRRRVFVVGHLGSEWEYPAKVLFESEGLFGNTPPKRVKGKGFTSDAQRGVGTAKSIRMRSGKPGGGKGALIGDNLSHTIATGNDQTIVAFGNGNDTTETANDRMPDKNKLPCVISYNGAGNESGDVTPTLQANLGKLFSNQTHIVLNLPPVQECIILNDQGGSVMNVEEKGTAGCLRANTHDNEQIVCVHGAQTPISNSQYANPLGACNNGLENVVCYAAAGFGQRVEDNVASTLSSDHDDHDRVTGNNAALIVDSSAFAIAENIIGRSVENGGNGVGVQNELAYTQNATGVMGVAVNNKGEYYGDATKTRSLQVLLDLRNKIGEETFQQWCFGRLVGFQKKEVLQQKMYEQSLHGKTEEKQSELDDSPLSRTELDAENALLRLWQSSKLGYPPYRQELAQQFVGELNLLMQKLSYQNTPYKNATVRRLLPIEAERLMGFPDNWTRIPWKGKPAEECPDSPRYKACGNSMCVNVMRWIGKRIDMVTKGEL